MAAFEALVLLLGHGEHALDWAALKDPALHAVQAIRHGRRRAGGSVSTVELANSIHAKKGDDGVNVPMQAAPAVLNVPAGHTETIQPSQDRGRGATAGSF